MTERLRADAAGIARAASVMRAGGLVAFGTETVYGLGADATNDRAVAGVFAAKGRPRFNPLICHYPDAAATFAQVTDDARARRLAAALWPGPLTLVLPRRPDCSVALLTGAGLDTLAVRVPAHPAALALLRAVDRPVAAPSANRSGRISPTTAEHVLAELQGRIDAVLDSGPCAVGVESTVLDLSGLRPMLLRPGGVAIETIEALIGPVARGTTPAQTRPPRSPAPTGSSGSPAEAGSWRSPAETGSLSSPAPTGASGSPAASGPLGSAESGPPPSPAETGRFRSPGMLSSHYAPTLPVRLNAHAVAPDEALLAFAAPLEGAGLVFNLSPAGDPTEAATRFFAGLRWLDTEGRRLGLRGIAAMAVPDAGLGLAINDRLQRAAAPRSA